MSSVDPAKSVNRWRAEEPTETPRILAIDHVRMTARLTCGEALCHFYGELLGLEPVDTADDEKPSGEVICFRGTPRSGPRLIITLTTAVVEKPPRRRVVIQIPRLHACADALTQAGIGLEWISGWLPHDRRLQVTDPGGNLIELVSSHAW